MRNRAGPQWSVAMTKSYLWVEQGVLLMNSAPLVASTCSVRDSVSRTGAPTPSRKCTGPRNIQAQLMCGSPVEMHMHLCAGRRWALGRLGRCTLRPGRFQARCFLVPRLRRGCICPDATARRICQRVLEKLPDAARASDKLFEVGTCVKDFQQCRDASDLPEGL